MNRIVKALIISLAISSFLVPGSFLLVKKIRENKDLHYLLKNKPAAHMYTLQGRLRLSDDHSDHSSPALEPLRKRLSPLCAHLQLQKTNDGVYTLTADDVEDTALLKTLLSTRSSLQWWPLYNITEFVPFLLRADSLLQLSIEKKGKPHSEAGTDSSTVTTVEQLLAKKEDGRPIGFNDEGLKHPLLSLFHISSFSDSSNISNYSQVGFVSIADTGTLNQYLENPVVKACMPVGLELMYGKAYSTEEESPLFFYLYAVDKTDPRPMLDGSFLVDASLATKQRNGQQQVTLRFNQSGRSRLERLTIVNTGRCIAMVANNEVLIAPKVDDPISSGIMLFTSYNEKDARLVYLLAKYPLPASVSIDHLSFAPQAPPSPFKSIWLLIGLAVFSLVFGLTLSIDKAFKNMATGKRQ